MLVTGGLILSVILGACVVFALRPGPATIKMLLAFSGAYLLSICVLELIPEVYSILERDSGLFIMAGFLIQLLLSYFSDGVEHGHMHTGHKGFSASVLMSLFIHSFVEGMAVGGSVTETHFGQMLLAGILMHKVPVAIVVTSVLLHGGTRMRNVYGIIGLFALTGPAGALLSTYFAQQWLSEIVMVSVLLAVVSGMLLHISTIILFETSHNHRFNAMKLLTILVGVVLALGSHFLA